MLSGWCEEYLDLMSQRLCVMLAFEREKSGI